MSQKKTFTTLIYLASIIFLPWWVSLSFNKNLESWDKIIKEYPETHVQKLCIDIHKETIQLVKMHNGGHIHSILHFSTNIICFAIISGYFILGNEELLDIGFYYNDQIISGHVSTFQVILDTLLKYWIFRYLNRVSLSHVVICHSMNY
ncbi:hypothetical protein MKW92_043800 [Papaver armeniacum]|nr:hypothetical protein MKW92_043800 [Papaver armeniacum]